MLRLILALVLASAASAAGAGPSTDGSQPSPRVLPGEEPVPRAQIRDEHCLDCHGVKGFAEPIGEFGEGPKRRLDLDPEALHASVHGGLQCLECHGDIEQSPHRKEPLAKVDCVGCHEELPIGSWEPKRAHWLQGDKPALKANADSYLASAHADPTVPGNAGCADCHTGHYVFPSDDPRAATSRENSAKLCGGCHEQALSEYNHSIHGAALLKPWAGDSATCGDCHDSHAATDPKGLPAHRRITEQCGDCHGQAVEGYMGSTHGQLAWLGNEDVPKCVNCHSGHDIRKIDDPASPVAADHLLETCRECHKEANAQFVKYHPHGTTSDFGKYPLMWLVAKGMAALILAVLAFFYLHSVLWFYREKKERPVQWRHAEGRAYPERIKRPKPESGVHYRRFSRLWRFNHWALALSVMTLVFTGMVVMYPETAWAAAISATLGGDRVLGIIHRSAGVVFLLAVFGHAAVVLTRLLRKGGFDWFGPDSLLPRRKDWEDMKGQFRWFFGKGPQPQFDRWTYWEKFDYWAVYWGALVIGLSGVFLWFSDAVGQVLPGWAFNLAAIAHGLEAFLAVMTLFVVHFFNNHFRPAKFPLDTVMFTGSWDLEELKEERPLEYRRLKESGELEARLVAPPSRRARVVWHLLGYTLLGTGLTLLALVVNGFVQRGLF